MDAEELEAERVHARARRGYRVLVALSCLLFALGGLALGRAIFGRHGNWDPLGPYSIQEVHLDRSNIDGLPTLTLTPGAVVPVTAEKCADGTGFTITGTSSWQSVDPAGTSIEVGSGVRDATDGCTSIDYGNVVPPEVRAAMRAQIAAGVVRPQWRITGVETPIRDGEEGIRHTWRTEAFAVELP